MLDFLKNQGGRVLVGLLVALNVALIAMLVIRQHDLERPQTAIPAADAPTSGAQTTSAPGSSTASSSDSSPSGGGTDQLSTGGAGGSRRLLAADSDQVAWRAETGDCNTPATVEVTTDGGDSWRATDPGIRSIVRLKAFGSDAVFAIGADADCKPTYAWIEGPDKKWQRDASQTSDKWYRVPSDQNQIHDAEGKTSRPCDDGVAALAGLGTYQAAVLCNDGRIRTRDQGRDWRTVDGKSGAVALNADNSRFVAAVTDQRCKDGLSIRIFDVDGNGLARGSGSCRRAPARATHRTAVSNIYTQVWLWSGQRVSVGTD